VLRGGPGAAERVGGEMRVSGLCEACVIDDFKEPLREFLVWCVCGDVVRVQQSICQKHHDSVNLKTMYKPLIVFNFG
jgi:hypothetical protein